MVFRALAAALNKHSKNLLCLAPSYRPVRFNNGTIQWLFLLLLLNLERSFSYCRFHFLLLLEKR